MVLDKEFFISPAPRLLISPHVDPKRVVEIIKEHGDTINNLLKDREIMTNKINFILARLGLASFDANYILQSDPGKNYLHSTFT